MLGNCEICSAVIGLTEGIFFVCLKMNREIQSNSLLYVSLAFFWHALIIMPASWHCLFAKVWVSPGYVIFFSIVWCYCKVWEFTLIPHSSKNGIIQLLNLLLKFLKSESLLSLQVKHEGSITAVQTWVALRVADCIVCASAECTGAYSRRLCDIKF